MCDSEICSINHYAGISVFLELQSGCSGWPGSTYDSWGLFYGTVVDCSTEQSSTEQSSSIQSSTSWNLTNLTLTNEFRYILDLKDGSGMIQATAFGTFWAARFANLIVNATYSLQACTVKLAFSKIPGFHSNELTFTNITKVSVK